MTDVHKTTPRRLNPRQAMAALRSWSSPRSRRAPRAGPIALRTSLRAPATTPFEGAPATTPFERVPRNDAIRGRFRDDVVLRPGAAIGGSDGAPREPPSPSKHGSRAMPLRETRRTPMSHRVAVALARPGRFELPTPGSVDQCSIQLSYGRISPCAGPRTILALLSMSTA